MALLSFVGTTHYRRNPNEINCIFELFMNILNSISGKKHILVYVKWASQTKGSLTLNSNIKKAKI